MRPYAIITPLKAIRMLLDGSAVLVRSERWEQITMPPRSSRWKAQHVGCQQAVDNVKADYEKMLGKQIHFICQDCSEAFAVPLSTFARQRIHDIMAPALCNSCGHGAED